MVKRFGSRSIRNRIDLIFLDPSADPHPVLQIPGSVFFQYRIQSQKDSGLGSGSASKNLSILSQKLLLSFRKWIPDPGPDFSPIMDPGPRASLRHRIPDPQQCPHQRNAYLYRVPYRYRYLTLAMKLMKSNFWYLSKSFFYQLAILTTFLSAYISVNCLFLRLKDTNLTKEKKKMENVNL